MPVWLLHVWMFGLRQDALLLGLDLACGFSLWQTICLQQAVAQGLHNHSQGQLLYAGYSVCSPWSSVHCVHGC